MEADRGHACPRDQPAESQGERIGVDRAAALGGEDEILIDVGRTGSKPLLQLPHTMAAQALDGGSGKGDTARPPPSSARRLPAGWSIRG